MIPAVIKMEARGYLNGFAAENEGLCTNVSLTMDPLLIDLAS
jgi:hypothetical protein